MIKRISFNSPDVERLRAREKMAHELTGKTKKRGMTLGRKIAIGVAVLAVGALAFGGYKAYTLGNRVFANGDSNKSVFEQIKLLTNSESAKITGEEEGRINILLLGVAAEGYAGAGLSDVNMIISVKPDTNQISLISVPRDLWVKIPGNGYNKLNAAHAFGEQAKKDGGPELAMQVMSNITGLPIHYWGRLDFEGFVRIIDDVGGVDVPIENGFTDYLRNARFEQGVEHMDGTRALVYVRARYVNGPEGSDFARARRQQQILQLVRDKVLTSGMNADVTTITKILDSLSKNVRTSMTPAEMVHLYDLVKNVPDENIVSKVIDGESGLVVSKPQTLGGQTVSALSPADPTFKQIRAVCANIFDSGAAEAENAKVEVQNGSGISKAASKTADQLSFNVVKIGTAARSDFDTTIIYDYTGGKKPKTLESLQSEFGVSATALPDDPTAQDKIRQSDSADFVIIIGKDYANKL